MAEEKATEKKVKIKLPLTRTEKDDVYVCVNGISYLIKRGETVEVPDYVAEVLQHKEEMLAVAMEFEAQAAANADQ
jgi:ribosomal protein L18E